MGKTFALATFVIGGLVIADLWGRIPGRTRATGRPQERMTDG